MPVPFTDDEFHLFSEWIAEEFGLRFGPEKREILRARLEPRRVALNLESFERLLFHVRFHPDRARERARLASRLTNNESYFFRERPQLDLLRTDVIPELARAARRGGASHVPIRVLSAGCASGEEAYTLAIVAREALGSRPPEVRVTGLDVDREALDRAEAALYRRHALRGVPDSITDRYFSREESGWRLHEEIRRAARFKQGNLVDPGWTGAVAPQDVVFCRNVLIYFDREAMRRAVENLYRVVRPGGFLFLGHAESLSRIPTRFVPERKPGVVYYRRVEEE